MTISNKLKPGNESPNRHASSENDMGTANAKAPMHI